LLNLAALPEGTGSFLLETGPTFQLLSAERDLIDDHAEVGSGILVVGDPEFDRVPPPIAAVAVASPNLRGSWQDCLPKLGHRFRRLPMLSREVAEIDAIWRRSTTGMGATKTLKGVEASERAFREQAPGRRVVHVATHGFFVESSCDSRAEPAGPAAPENALLRSGLAFAGANGWQTIAPGVPDGILTAEEVATLDLHGVEWAVLSACETGVGTVAAGEGVFGLRRAFRLAGARTVVMSLWPVADEAALVFMRSLYRERFAAGRPTAAAVRAASRAVLRLRRSRGRSSHPFHWASFVAVGHDR
jgi:CHAT domain-containing protein